MELIHNSQQPRNSEPKITSSSINTDSLPRSTESGTTITNRTSFIEANTQEISLSYLKKDCTIPVYTKDNEITISHQQFIEMVYSCITSFFKPSEVSTPEIRVSHEIKGRTPDALHIPAKELQEHQRTTYFERMAFVIRIPAITDTVSGNKLMLTVGGVRAYNQENLYSKKSIEKFKFFIGFKNLVCCNLCVSSDGFQQEIRAMSSLDLRDKIMNVIEGYNAQRHLQAMKALTEYSLTEKQFAQLIGRSRLYQFLPKKEKVLLPELLLNDGHINAVARDYYLDESFCRGATGEVSLWNVYNLFTGANKSSYIDTFLDRGANAFTFTEGIMKTLSGGDTNYSWFLS